MKLVLIRHGQTPSNVLGLLDTALPGAMLTDLGHAQAQQVPAMLMTTELQAVYASAALRAQQTAGPLATARGLDLVVRDGLREIAAGDWEMAGDDESVQAYLGLIGGWLGGDLDLASPGPFGESGHAVLQRFDGVVSEIADSGVDAAAVVAHGAVIRFWATRRAVNVPVDHGVHRGLRNTEMVVLDGDTAGGWTVLEWAGRPMDAVPIRQAAFLPPA